MQPEDAARLKHILAAAANVARWIDGVDQPAYEANEMLQSALRYQIQIIGEAAYHLSDEFKAATPAIPWFRITGMRHRLVHDYFEIDIDVVWEVVTDRIPILVRQLLPFAPAEEE